MLLSIRCVLLIFLSRLYNWKIRLKERKKKINRSNRILSKKFLLRVYSSCFLNRIEVQSKYNVYFIILISAFEFHCIHSHSYAQDLLYRSALVSISIDEEYSDKSRFLTSRVFNVMATFKVFFKLLAEGNLVHATILSHANPLQRKYFLRTLHEEISTKRYLVRFSRFLRRILYYREGIY